MWRWPRARVRVTPPGNAKAAEGTAALHDARARFAYASILAKPLECACLFWRFSDSVVATRSSDRQAGDAAFMIIGSEHGGPEEVLVYSDAHHAFAFESFFRQFAFIDLSNLFQLAPAETSQQPFAFKSQGFRVILEITPDLDFAFCSVSHPLNATSLQLRIEPGKIVEFQRDCTRGAAHQFGKIHDFRRATVLPAKRNLAVEVERENVFISGPLVGWLWHLRRLTDGMEKSRKPFTTYAGWYLTAKIAKTQKPEECPLTKSATEHCERLDGACDESGLLSPALSSKGGEGVSQCMRQKERKVPPQPGGSAAPLKNKKGSEGTRLYKQVTPNVVFKERRSVAGAQTATLQGLFAKIDLRDGVFCG